MDIEIAKRGITMDIEIAEMGRMAQTGSSLLRSIQNNHTPALDLLVRESIQNSLDAARSESQPVKFDLSVRRFENNKVSKRFSGITEKLNNRYSNIGESIVIRDVNTTGLTGPIHQDYVKNNEFGNLLKLIYEISMPQEKKEAGGSWGLGKTVYFRIGIGLVVYYSRIKLENGSYESRLAACLVEDESKEDTLIPSTGATNELKRGIAWWGEYHKSNSTKPITDERYIAEFLEDFDVKPFENDETGTTVIIPYVDEDNLLIIPENHTKSNHEPWWYSSIESYLYIAIQRWYAPRIDNPSYKFGNYLLPSIDTNLILKDDLEPLFKIIRSLYIYAQTNNKESIIDKSTSGVSNIPVHRDLKINVAGQVAFIKATKKDLHMEVPNLKRSPYDYIDETVHNGADNNSPIVCYVRKPGMIVNYEIESKWTQGIEKTDPEEFIIAVFVPDSDNTVTLPDISLDEYLRQGEKADHSSWEDIVLGEKRFTIVERIQKYTAQSLRDAFNTEVEKVEGSRSSALSKSLASALLPPIGFGKDTSKPPKSSTENGKLFKQKSKSSFDIILTKVTKNTIMLTVEIAPNKNKPILEIETLVDSEGSRKIRGNTWEKDIKTKFPIKITSTSFKDNSNISSTIEKTDKHDVPYKYSFDLSEIDQKITASIELEVNDKYIQPSLTHNFTNEVDNK